MRISNLVALVNCLGIVVLGVLFYIVFSEEYKIIALVALGAFLAEAITLAVGKLGAFALIPLSQQFVGAGAPEPSYFQTLGDFLYYGVDRQGWALHMLFFCLGGILWYYLFFRSKAIPRILSVWGFAAVSLVSINVLFVLHDRDIELVMIMLASVLALFIDLPESALGLMLPLVLFELLLGFYLAVFGMKDGTSDKASLA